MQIISLNTGLPRDVEWHGRTVSTAIYKTAVEGRRTMRRQNIDGDRQADRRVHGGAAKAAYCYPIEHYQWWMDALGGRVLEPGVFGENLTIDELDEETVHIGDRFAIGTATVVVTQPRLPCYKLGIRFGDDGMVHRFMASGRTGFYLAVQQEGEIGSGDTISLIDRDPGGVRVADITRAYAATTLDRHDVSTLRKAVELAALPESWKSHFRNRLALI